MTSAPIVVGIGDSPASLDALQTAGVQAAQLKTRVLAIHVIEVQRALPLDADLDAESSRGEQLLRRAEHVAAEHGFTIEGELLQAREAGQALVEEAKRRGAAVIVLGISYKRLVGQFDFGRTADYVLRHAGCPVWLVRPAVEVQP
jgi:nucleotide-binding universal stress UspA family protein